MHNQQSIMSQNLRLLTPSVPMTPSQPLCCTAPLEFYDKADLSTDNDVSVPSSDVCLDQSNHGFSFFNLHWASFSAGLSSVLAVVLAIAFISVCCYFCGRCQRQPRASVAGATRTSSTHQQTQPGAYPGTSMGAPLIRAAPSDLPAAEPQLVFEPAAPSVRPSVAYSAARFTPSCGFPGCSTSYTKVSAILNGFVEPSAPPTQLSIT